MRTSGGFVSDGLASGVWMESKTVWRAVTGWLSSLVSIVIQKPLPPCILKSPSLAGVVIDATLAVYR